MALCVVSTTEIGNIFCMLTIHYFRRITRNTAMYNDIVVA